MSAVRSEVLERAHPALRNLPMFELMPEEIRKLVVDSFVPVSYSFGSVIVRERRSGRRALRPRLRTGPGREVGRARRGRGPAPLIVVVERSQIVDRGTHDELMARQGLHFYLMSQQLGL